ncbi:MAG TPA: helix-turn-helix domain-containing protein [Solirubrobacterales bacterium]
MSRRPTREVRGDLHARLNARRPEIEDAVLTRVFAVSDPSGPPVPEYTEGLRAAVGAALDYGLAAVNLNEERSPLPPPALLAQARMAARHGVSLDTVLRRYIAGQALLADFLVEEAEAGGLTPGELQRLLRGQAALIDRLLSAVSEEYTRESEGRLSSAEQRNERIERLLAGEPLDTSHLSYDFEAHHLGAIAKGPGAAEAIRALVAPLDRRLLLVERSDGAVWAWLGGRRPIDPQDLQRNAAGLPPQVSLALGEPATGLGGWRLTHQQARAALPIAMRSPDSVVRYADVALLASILQDDLFATSLRALYLAPLQRERDGGEAARETLRAYFTAGRNVSSAAASLGVSRRTVANRLRVIEGHLGFPLAACTAEMEAALRLNDLDRAPLPPNITT